MLVWFGRWLLACAIDVDAVVVDVVGVGVVDVAVVVCVGV